MAALRERDRTDQHQIVDVAMLDTALNLMANNVVTTANTGVDLPKLGNEAASRAPSSGCFETQDGGLIMLAANNERQFKDLCMVVGHEEWVTDPRWNSPMVRAENQETLRQELIAVFLTKPAQDWEVMLDRAGVPSSRVRTLKEVISEGQPEARSLLGELKVGDAEVPTRLPAIGFRLNGDSLRPKRPPRKVGEDNKRYLS